MAKALLDRLGIKVSDYSTINRGIRRLNIPTGIERSAKAYQLAIDATGFKVKNRGYWMWQKLAVGRGWIELHMTCDVANHVITSVKITNENGANGRQFNDLVSDAGENVGEIER